MRRNWLVGGALAFAFILIHGPGAGVVSAQTIRPPAPPPASATSSPASTDARELRDEIERLRLELEQLRKQYEERLSALEARLQSGPPRPSGPTGLQTPQNPPAQPPPDQPPPQTPPAGLSSKVFNPDISVIGNFVGVAGKNAFSGQPPLQLTEAEASFQAIVDPYARADFFLAAGPKGVDVEEGFITFTSLPKSLLLKVGKMRAQFGKVNTLHTHQMPTVDRPLVTENLVGGEEGLSDSGLSLSHLFPTEMLYLELTGEVFRGDSEVFQSSNRSRLNYVGRVRAFRDITEGTNIDLGASFAYGPTNIGLESPIAGQEGELPIFNKRLFGVDATFRYRPLRRAIYQRLNLRTELIWSRQELPDDLHAASFGFYGLGEYQFARRWYIGARADRSARALDSSLTDSGASVFMTFWPTEFSQIRGQLRRTNYAEGISGNEFLFQFNFSIGAHGAHIF
jgi:hypothetical protein